MKTRIFLGVLLLALLLVSLLRHHMSVQAVYTPISSQTAMDSDGEEIAE